MFYLYFSSSWTPPSILCLFQSYLGFIISWVFSFMILRSFFFFPLIFTQVNSCLTSLKFICFLKGIVFRSTKKCPSLRCKENGLQKLPYFSFYLEEGIKETQYFMPFSLLFCLHPKKWLALIAKLRNVNLSYIFQGNLEV